MRIKGAGTLRPHTVVNARLMLIVNYCTLILARINEYYYVNDIPVVLLHQFVAMSQHP